MNAVMAGITDLPNEILEFFFLELYRSHTHDKTHTNWTWRPAQKLNREFLRISHTCRLWQAIVFNIQFDNQKFNKKRFVFYYNILIPVILID